jgi:hypothetical protein
MKRIAIRYALIVFFITIAWTLLEHVLGYNTTKHEIGQYTRGVSAFVYYAAVALAIWRVRSLMSKQMTFGQGMRTGLYCSLTYSFLVTLWFALYAEVINKQYQPTLLAFMRKKLQAANLSEENIAKRLQMETLRSGGSVTSYVLLFFVMLVFGLIVSAIASALMQKRAKMAI